MSYLNVGENDERFRRPGGSVLKAVKEAFTALESDLPDYTAEDAWVSNGALWQLRTQLSLVHASGGSVQVVVPNPAVHFDIRWWVLQLDTAIVGNGSATIKVGTTSGTTEIAASVVWDKFTAQFTKWRSAAPGSVGAEAGNGSDFDAEAGCYAYDEQKNLYLKATIGESAITAGVVKFIAFGVER